MVAARIDLEFSPIGEAYEYGSGENESFARARIVQHCKLIQNTFMALIPAEKQRLLFEKPIDLLEDSPDLLLEEDIRSAVNQRLREVWITRQEVEEIPTNSAAKTLLDQILPEDLVGGPADPVLRFSVAPAQLEAGGGQRSYYTGPTGQTRCCNSMILLVNEQLHSFVQSHVVGNEELVGESAIFLRVQFEMFAKKAADGSTADAQAA